MRSRRWFSSGNLIRLPSFTMGRAPVQQRGDFPSPTSACAHRRHRARLDFKPTIVRRPTRRVRRTKAGRARSPTARTTDRKEIAERHQVGVFGLVKLATATNHLLLKITEVRDRTAERTQSEFEEHSGDFGEGCLGQCVSHPDFPPRPCASADQPPAPTINRNSKPSHIAKSVRASCIMLRKP